MNILGFDCSGNSCSVAVLRDGAIAAHRAEAMSRGQSEALMPMIREAMREADLTFAALDLVAVTIGPGAFTGIRIGLAAARGLALAAGVPAVGVTSFEAVRQAVPSGRPVLVAIDSRREELFVQPFDEAGHELAAPSAMLPESLGAWRGHSTLIVAGDGAERAAIALPGAETRPLAIDARHVTAVAARRGVRPENSPPHPLYLRGADVTLPSGVRTTVE